MKCSVALLSPPYSTLAYELPDYIPEQAWALGQRVLVPLGKGLRTGVLLDWNPERVEESKLKAMLWPLEPFPLFNQSYLELICSLAKRYLVCEGKVLANVLPAGLKATKQEFVLDKDVQGRENLSALELARQNKESCRELAGLWMQGKMQPKGIKDRSEEIYYSLAKDPPWGVRPMAVRQLKVLESIYARGVLSLSELKKACGGWSLNVVQELRKKGLIQVVDPDQAPEQREGVASPRPKMTLEQRESLGFLEKRLRQDEPEVSLLFGVTGSGKTLVYLELALVCLEMGLSVLLLVPEVALAWQIWSQAKAYLADWDLFFYHGYQTPTQKARTFRQVRELKKPCAVVGTRSAAFLPRNDWGLMVLDEEHDPSFKQEERFCYQAKEIAYFWLKQNKGLLLLGSATPDIRTYYSVQQKSLSLTRLLKRVGPHPLPEVKVIDLQQDKAEFGPFAGYAHERIQETLSSGDQVIVLLNRRGYAPLVYCASCQKILKCHNCEVSLTYHKKQEILLCHYCGLSLNFPLSCPNCGGHQFVPLSEGTEQVEEYLSGELSKDTRVLRLDRDSTRRAGSMEEILTKFSNREASVLIGTQMCSKGHNFPGVTLVVVLDGDLGLNLPDYRASERTFQLLVQVSGRAGRGDKPGEVIIQTRNPKHYCWQHIKENDFEGFYQKELALRRDFEYPPFVKLALIRFTFPSNWQEGEKRVRELSKALRQGGTNKGITVLGLAPAPLSKLKNRLRYQCLLKASTWQAIRELSKAFMKYAEKDKKMDISLDLDPVNML